MRKLQAKTDKAHQGFTLIELMVVLTIFGVLIGILLVNLAGQRLPRNIKIAQNELVTNLRKLQSYTLSSRAIFGNQPAQFYVMKLDLAQPEQYTVQAIYDVSTAPKLADNLEVIHLPQGIRLAASNAFQIDRPPIGGSPDSYDSPPTTINNCLLVAFKLPFGKVISNNGCSQTSPPFQIGDDYGKIKDFEINSVFNTASENSSIAIQLTDEAGTLAKTVTINGILGVISAQ